MPKSWYAIKNKAADSAEISIYDEIGRWGVSARHFAASLKDLGDVKDITVSINSPGGSLFDGLAIHNMLKRHPATVTVIIDGIAASAASVVAMAGDRVVMPENAFLMIHEASGEVMGTADDMREYADFLDKTLASIVSVYRPKTTLDDDELIEMIKAESWLSALDAVALGFATEMVDAKKIVACCDMSRFERPPEIKNLADDPETPPAVDDPAIDPPEVPAVPPEPAAVDAAAIVDLCNEAGFPAIASSLITAKATLEQTKARIQAAGEIRTLCKTARLPDRADDYIKAGLNVQEVRASLFDALAAKDTESVTNPWHQPKITNQLAPNNWDAVFDKVRGKKQ